MNAEMNLLQPGSLPDVQAGFYHAGHATNHGHAVALAGMLMFAWLQWTPLAAFSTGLPPAQDPPDAQAEFSRIDTNHDGGISLPELIAAGRDDLTFRAMDINGDGSLSPEEYGQRPLPKAMHPGKQP